MANKIRCFFTSLTAVSLATLALPEVQAQVYTNEIIYSNSLQNGWANWSWGSTINLSCTAPVRNGDTDSISVSSASYSALYLEAPDFDSNVFTNLTVWLNGGSS